MKRSLLWIFSVLALGTFLALLPLSAAAQTLWTSPDQGSNLALEWLRPEFDEGDDLSFFTSGLFLSGRAMLSDNVALVADLPFAFVDADFEFGGSESDVTMGNPLLGLEVQRGSFWLDTGLRVPLAPSDNAAVWYGFWSDYDRCEAFMPDVLSAFGAINYQFRRPDSHFSMRLRGGPLMLVETEEDVLEDNTEFFAIYSLQGWYDTPKMRFGAGFTGRLWATESDLDFGERSAHSLGLTLAGKFGGVEPGLHFRLPLDEDVDEVMDYSIGLNVTVPFGQR